MLPLVITINRLNYITNVMIVRHASSINRVIIDRCCRVYSCSYDLERSQIAVCDALVLPVILNNNSHIFNKGDLLLPVPPWPDEGKYAICVNVCLSGSLEDDVLGCCVPQFEQVCEVWRLWLFEADDWQDATITSRCRRNAENTIGTAFRIPVSTTHRAREIAGIMFSCFH